MDEMMDERTDGKLDQKMDGKMDEKTDKASYYAIGRLTASHWQAPRHLHSHFSESNLDLWRK